MKKIALSIFFFAFALTANAQETIQTTTTTTSTLDLPRNEVKWNIANTIIFGSVEVGYEYFLDGHQSIGAEILINDAYNFGINSQYKDFDTNSFSVNYSYYTGAENNASGFVISPFLKFRTGTYQRDENIPTPVIDMDSFIIGIGGGYKWNLSNKFVFGPYFSVGRNFSNTVNDEFNIAVEVGAGFGIGYRF
jgi:hypothetical protein